MNPFVFIVGCPRSGTTLLQRMVDAHPQIAIINETRWIAGFYERRKGVTPDGLVTPELIPRLLEYDRFAKLSIGPEELERLMGDGEPVSYASFVSGIFDLYGQARQKPLVGDKTPRYSRRLLTLHTLWPEAKFVHLIRDGRDTGLSILNWRKADRALGRFSTWGEDPVATTAVWWEWHVRLAREAGRNLGPELYYELRYEALVAHPEEECANLCAFLGLAYDEAMPRFHEGRTKAGPDLDAKRAWLPVTLGLRDWRSQMPADGIEQFEAAAGDLLDELGYPRAVPHPLSETLQHASRVRDRFVQEACARGSVLPEPWALVGGRISA
jgi:hypothetical protein